MPKIEYVPRRFKPAVKSIIAHANVVIDDYTKQGYVLTLRQLYYKFIAKDLFPETWIDEAYNRKHGLDPRTKNTIKNYKRLGSIVNDARLAGLLDWNAIEDRGRCVRAVPHWGKPSDIIDSAAASFRIDKWVGQKYRPEVWVEKEALAGVISPVCGELDISYLACKGYTSQSEMWASAMRLKRIAKKQGQTPIILHFGDHDPSGMDMTHDIENRLKIFTGGMELRRLALNMSQIEQYKPPPNPAKETDARFMKYQRKYGKDSWELDALEPAVLAQLIRDAVATLRDQAKYDELVNQEMKHREQLRQAAAKLRIKFELDELEAKCDFYEEEQE